MPIRERAATIGRANARRRTETVLADADIARRAVGMSLDELARACEMSRSQARRLLHSETRYPTVDQLGRLCAAVGLRLAMRAYPDGDPVRDAAHTALLGRIRSELHSSLRWRTEVPLSIDGDLRAWDAIVGAGEETVGVEAERRLSDVQATQRRIALKQRHGGIDKVLLVMADTKANHRAFESAAAAVRSQFRVGPRVVLARLRSGRLPLASGYVFV